MRKSTKKNKSSKGSRPNYQKQLARDHIPKQLPQIDDQLCVGMKLRFVTTGNFTGVFSVTASNLLDAWFVAGTATTAYQLFDFVRIKRVTIRAMGMAPSAGLAPMATVGVEFFGLSAGQYAGGRQKEDSQLGYDTPAMVTLTPDPQSQAAQFQPSTGNSIFGIRAVDSAASPIYNAIIDVDVVYRNSADVNPAAVGVARAGLTAGNLYFGGLDGQPLATTAARSTFQKRA